MHGVDDALDAHTYVALTRSPTGCLCGPAEVAKRSAHVLGPDAVLSVGLRNPRLTSRGCGCCGTDKDALWRVVSTFGDNSHRIVAADEAVAEPGAPEFAANLVRSVINSHDVLKAVDRAREKQTPTARRLVAVWDRMCNAVYSKRSCMAIMMATEVYATVATLTEQALAQKRKPTPTPTEQQGVEQEQETVHPQPRENPTRHEEAAEEAVETPQ